MAAVSSFLATSLAVAAPLQVTLAQGGPKNLTLIDFGPAGHMNPKVSATWRVTNDPVMGGQSESTFDVVEDPSVPGGRKGKFSGENKIVPSLKAPGFCSVYGIFDTGDMDLSGYGYTDGATGKTAIKLVVKSETPSYEGFKLGLSGKDIPKTSIFGGGSFKAAFKLPADTEPGNTVTVYVPIGDFSYDWSGFTGDCSTKDPPRGLNQQHYCCPASGLSPSNPKVCAAPKYLTAISALQLWAEGVAGKFDLEVLSIAIDSM